MGERHNGEPFFYYLYRCQLWRPDLLIAEGDGSCNSFEAKYRYRDAQRVCPECDKPAIVNGREGYGGGWICFAKRGGCGAKFADGDAIIEGQPIGRVLNPDIADQVNTIQKMAQKRALIAATLLAVNASEFFTQDVEDRQITVSPIAATNLPGRLEETLSVSFDATAVESKLSDGQTATDARTLFERKARERFHIHDRKQIACLAVALLQRRPERWTAQVWQEATDKPDEVWNAALQALHGPDG